MEDEAWGARPSIWKIVRQNVQRIRAAGGLSGIRPLDLHNGQITTLDKRPSRGESTVSKHWPDKKERRDDDSHTC